MFLLEGQIWSEGHYLDLLKCFKLTGDEVEALTSVQLNCKHNKHTEFSVNQSFWLLTDPVCSGPGFCLLPT